MTAKTKESAEAKLLKMIEATSGGNAPDAVKTGKKVAKKKSVLTLIKNINRVLLIVFVVAVAFFVNEVRAGIVLMNQSVKISVNENSTKHAGEQSNFIPPIQRLSFYLASIKERNIFEPWVEPEVKNVVVVSEENRKIARKTSHLRLVGVSWLDSIESASVMIEDVNKQVTHFLKAGEKVDDIQVKTIYADSVELGYENEEIIIRYDKSQM